MSVGNTTGQAHKKRPEAERVLLFVKGIHKPQQRDAKHDWACSVLPTGANSFYALQRTPISGRETGANDLSRAVQGLPTRQQFGDHSTRSLHLLHPRFQPFGPCAKDFHF